MTNRLPLWIGIAALAAIAVRSALYLADPNLPFGFYYDLGWNGMLFAYIPHMLHSGRDAIDLLGWSAWYDQPTFYLNTMGTYVLLTPLALVLHNGWLTVKAAQLLQIAVAIAGTAWAYRVMARGSWTWGLLAGLAYALAPVTAISIQHDLDMGFAMALIPLAIAIGVTIVRAIGAAALPMAAAVIGIAAFCFHLEYGFFLGIPAYVLLCVYASFRERQSRTWLWAAAGFVVLCAVPAYTVLTTLSYRGLYSDWAGRVSELDSASKLALFSESPWALAGATLQEFIIDPNPLFNASSSMAFAVTGGVIVWLAALVYAVRALRGTDVRRAIGLALGIIAIVLLALGSNGPLGFVYELVKDLPVLNALRTPDRFIALPLLAACLAAAALAERARRTQMERMAGLALVLAVLFCWGTADVTAHVLATQRSATHEPDLDAVSRVVARMGGRTFSAAFVRNGTVFDTPAYGAPTPSTRSGVDIFGRYISTPSAGLGLLARSGVRSVITSPDWLATQSNAPIDVASRLMRSGLVQPVWRAPSGVAVYRVARARPEVTPVQSVCLSGGPGLADFVSALPAFSGAALVHQHGMNCTQRLFLDYDPRAEAPAQTTQFWPGTQIFSYLPRTGDADYSYAVDRFYLNDPWYRDSVDGDEAVFTQGPLAVGTIPFSTALHPIVRTAQPFVFRIHMAAHAATEIAVSVDARAPQTIDVPSERGLRWFDFDLGRLARGSHTISVSVTPLSVDRSYGLSAGDVVDGAALVPAAAPMTVPGGRSAAFWTLRSIAGHALHLGHVYDLLPAKTPWESDAPVSRLRVRWMAPSGRYQISVVGRVRGAPAWIAAGNRALVTPVSQEPQTLITIPMQVRHGEDVLVLTTGSASAAEAMPDVEITALRAIAAGRETLHYTTASGAERFVIDGAMGDRALAAATFTPGVRVNGGSIEAQRGDSFSTGITVPRNAGVLRATVDSSGSDGGKLTVDCGGPPSSALAAGADTSLAVVVRGTHCTLGVTWIRSGFTVRRLQATLGVTPAAPIHARVWLAGGAYRFKLFATPVREAAGVITIDGRRAGEAPMQVAAGRHAVSISGVSSAAYVLAALPAHATVPLRSNAVVSDRTSSTSFHVDVLHASTLELAELSDGQWWARDIRSGRRVRGERCDIFETCFAGLSPGAYVISHAWPLALRIGSVLSLLAIFGSCGLALQLFLVRRRAARSEHAFVEARS